MSTTQTVAPEVVEVKRTFTAPRDKVFEAWRNPKMMAKWFARGTPGQPLTEVQVADVRVGGKYQVVVRYQDKVYHMVGAYREVKPPERLAFTWHWEEADFRDSLVTVDFRELGGSSFTEVTLRHSLLPEKQREDHRQGWTLCFEMLDRTLAEK